MRIVRVDSHPTNTVTVWCSVCGRSCHAPARYELRAPYFDGGTNRTNYQRAWADLDAPAGTFYCTDCAAAKDPATVTDGGEMSKQCGYGSCSCVGVQFISSYDGYSDFCVGGQRVTVWPDRSVSCDPRIAQELNIFLLERYAAYLERRARQRAAMPSWFWPTVEEFGGLVWIR